MSKRPMDIEKAVDDALPALPTVLNRLIAAYCSRRHTWQTDGLTETTRIRTGTDLVETVVELVVGPIADLGWQTVVSTATIGDGDLNWTIAVGNHAKLTYVGLTILPTNVSGQATSAFRGSRTIISYNGGFLFLTDGHTDRQFESTRRTSLSTPIKYRFAADPKTNRIIVRSDAFSPNPETVFYTAASVDEFRSLRPCVVTDGNAKVFLSSEY